MLYPHDSTDVSAVISHKEKMTNADREPRWFAHVAQLVISRTIIWVQICFIPDSSLHWLNYILASSCFSINFLMLCYINNSGYLTQG